MSRRTLVRSIPVIGLASLAVGCAKADETPKPIENFVEIPPPPLGPASQTLTMTDGTPWKFSDPASGKLTLLYFGYTYCPDVCPTTMADLAAALGRLDSGVRDKVWVQFVSTDPDRDTSAQIADWLARFDPSFHGARGPIDDVIAAGQTYGVGIEAPVTKDGKYEVTHGAQLMVLNDAGQAVGFFRELVGQDDYAAGIPELVKRYV